MITPQADFTLSLCILHDATPRHTSTVVLRRSPQTHKHIDARTHTQNQLAFHTSFHPLSPPPMLPSLEPRSILYTEDQKHPFSSSSPVPQLHTSENQDCSFTAHKALILG